ncbi:hypothetical protein K8B83_11570 [Shewanella inventionis]|uniref:hypothetical protein n=1 Tax=Shewanella inventionis TaxID=1738770 RepID=UPI001CBE0416|nr:hypothetical protein [Shewanella inventionis]UAL41555.1 hypothetical protein K8B83_11570 [Shewanella inventionis]
MTKSIKYLLLAAVVCLALVCLFIGSVLGAVAFITMGLLLESAFWLGIITSVQKRKPT